MKEGNKAIKNLDNLAVITGLTGDQLRERVGEVYHIKDIAKAQISSMKAKEAKGHGNSYLYSRQLVESLKSPHADTFPLLPELRTSRSPQVEAPSSLMDQRLDTDNKTEIKSSDIRALGAIDRFRYIESSKKKNEKLKHRTFQKNSKLHIGDTHTYSHSTLRETVDAMNPPYAENSSSPPMLEPIMTKSPSSMSPDNILSSPHPIKEINISIPSAKPTVKPSDPLSDFLDKTIGDAKKWRDGAHQSMEGHVLQGHAIYKKNSVPDDTNQSKVSFLTKVGDIADKEKGNRKKRNGNNESQFLNS